MELREQLVHEVSQVGAVMYLGLRWVAKIQLGGDLG